jgi:hypothetical protein
VLDELFGFYKEGETRMSCQIKVGPELEGSEIEIPRSAFNLFDRFRDD